MAAVVAHHALGSPGGARCVEDIERVGGRDWDTVDRAPRHNGLVASLGPVEVAASNHCGLLLWTLQDEAGVGLVRRDADRLV